MNVKEAAKLIVDILTGAAPFVPEPFGALVRIAAAGIAAGAQAIDDGSTEAEVIARIHRVRHITP